ncbi:MAG: hypothetical protein CO158_00785 [Piscirickettsiaceae bacterium CG_4_9_14_3_um_filter_43_564]|nr:hypothetical protein [Thiomicrospira sp.]PIQ03224.1 MAG: hypothetical protein COW74_08115 [Piscirickettsiaceae bacterium CG18_big_fil_WC_8_21_14_2_50_44_103]PIU39499.1 MAG: hypothetical protein COT01_01395 [Piscirickettsiaceae bacterium CG07_land_8_20_14_0_80_44_28]PIW58586.1 MAG: hypothetical protein COW14_00815 [Piscirickettsiaceae bacterium CG12_big_fil_rev_8_21_14_0_65_44_934]PIW78445.1 MAG: hypothetical protein CO000_01930 [Piscirickettsiaceae bacterium CG_4_8_14_3_um_filter_44_38]PIX7
MAQTISELEKERAELLKVIESKAQNMSSSRPNAPEGKSEHTLNDWLNAAEEVMPTRSSRNSSNSQPESTPARAKPNKASFFGVIIMLSLFLTILGVVFIAYTNINSELQKALAINEENQKELSELKQTISDIQQTNAASGQGELFAALQKRVLMLETQLQTLKVQQVTSVPQQSASDVTAPTTKPLALEQLPSNVVTTEVLEQKLQEYTKGIDQKLETILAYLNNEKQSPVQLRTPQKQSTASAAKVTEPEITQPQAPKVKPMDQPVVRLVQKITSPKAAEEPSDPLENYTADVKWLVEEPAFNYTLQLASMSERSSVEKMIEQSKLQGARIIPLKRNGEAYYVLLSGSYESRSEADKAAQRYKNNFGISPWVRKIKDLSSKLN